MSYGSKLLRGFLLSYGGLMASAIFYSYFFARSSVMAAETPTLFHGLIVAPSEEMFFRFFVPLLLMYVGIPYLAGACLISSVLFGVAHWWAYGGNTYALMSAITSGAVNGFVVYYYSGREPFNFSPGLLCAILGHMAYNVTVTYIPQYIMYLAIIILLLYGWLETVAQIKPAND